MFDRKAYEQKKHQIKSGLFKVIGSCDSFYSKICRLLDEHNQIEDSMKRAKKVFIMDRRIDMPDDMSLGSNVRLDAQTTFIPLDGNESNVQEEKDFQKVAKKSLKQISELYKFEIDELAQHRTTLDVMKQGASKILNQPLPVPGISPSYSYIEKQKEESFRVNLIEAKQKEQELITDVSKVLKVYQNQKQIEDEF